jgi:putative inorganic carbon (HCO3(-)) transporter
MTSPRPATTIVPELRGTVVGLPSGRGLSPVQHGRTFGVGGLITVLFAPWIAVAGVGRKILLAVLLLDLPLHIEKNFNYLDDAAEFGAIGGFGISLTTLALAGLYAGWLADRAVGRDRASVVPPGLVQSLGAYLCVAALTLVVARDVGLYSRGLFLLVQMFLVYVYLVGNIRSGQDVRFVVTCLLCGLVLESLIILGSGLTGKSFAVAGLKARVDTATDDLGVSARFGGTVGSPNNAAEYLEMLLAPAVAVLGSTLGRFPKTLAGLGLALGSAALVGTFSRGGWIATTLSLAIVCVALWRRGRLSRVVPWLAGLVVAVSLIFHDSIAARLTGDDYGAAHARIPLMATAFRIIGDHPMLGVGVNNYTAALPDYAPRHQDEFLFTVHNQYLLVWAETGLAGLAVFMWFLITTIRHGMREWRLSDPLLSPLALGFTAGLVGQMVHMQVDLLNDRPQLQLLVTVAALLSSMSRMETPGSLMPRPLLTSRARALTAAQSAAHR